MGNKELKHGRGRRNLLRVDGGRGKGCSRRGANPETGPGLRTHAFLRLGQCVTQARTESPGAQGTFTLGQAWGSPLAEA